MSTLPDGFLALISAHPALSHLAEALLTEPDVSVRVNRAKLGPSLLPEVVGAEPQPVPWCADGFYLSERPQFTFDVDMHQGLYYVQDASSMAIAAVVRHLAEGPVRYLDACAAPGGKSTAALSALPAGSMLVANEYDFRRAEILAENVAKWGDARAMVTRGDTRRISALRDFFDIVAVDAPCSGEGMMRKEAKAVEQWSPALVANCAATQREIIGNVWPALAPGGYLIYSTCTFNLDEDERNLQWIIDTYGAEPVAIPELEAIEAIAPGIDTNVPCYRFLPGRVRGEGLFIAVVRKPGDASRHSSLDSRHSRHSSLDTRLSSLDPRHWFASPMQPVVVGNEIFAIPAELHASMLAAAARLDVLSMGVHAATVKGRDIVPTHELALSTALRSDAFPSVEVSQADALEYLRRGNITLPPSTPRGYVLLTHGSTPLGFVKNLGNRSNNLLPKNWRILSVPSR